MAAKLIVFAAALAAANAGLLAAPAYAPAAYAAPYAHAPAAVTSSSANILRSPGNLGQVSTFTKTVDTPYSSVSKSDVRVSNPGYATYAAPAYHAPAAYAAPAVVARPAVAAYAAPAYAAPAYAPRAYAAPAVAHGGLLGVAYSAAPAVSHMSFDGYGINYVY
ncbi:cuticle protein 67-like [Homalodisca vitripennis]|uniref:cuticle protein 67-like n=1 Tax=Homalodisca vitripennis TaxID=197043 RepID=UPI001EEC636B|nr:cuticle protein 67-like [Homalodisca vitripennis]